MLRLGKIIFYVKVNIFLINIFLLFHSLGTLFIQALISQKGLVQLF